ncbi:MAG: IS1380 family transposase [Acidobacteriaceae bacterium]|nr:IS1380 family transposase [Acidobacteriaceae bacterium]
MTECSELRFTFATAGRREMVAEFQGGAISSDGGVLLLHETERRLKLLERFSQCFLDGRKPALVEHPIEQLLKQRVYALALGYEDLNDHEQLRNDVLLQAVVGKREPEQETLAGKSTLNRMELGDGKPDRYKKITFWRDAIDDLLVDVFIEAHAAVPAEVVLDIDTTDMAIHGQQEGRFYHGFYDHYCYLPLYVFAGEYVLCARLRPSNIDPSAGSRKEMERIVKRIRARWPEVKIVLRADSGFCREELMAWCEANRVDYVFGMARNAVLEKKVAEPLEQARQHCEQTQRPARVFVEFEHETVSGTWSRRRRVVAKAEYMEGKANPRFVVTSLQAETWAARRLYEDLYCARGDMENRIKEQFMLFADRVSAATMRANQLRLYLSVMAYSLVCGLRRLGLKATQLAQAQMSTIRLRLLKLGAEIRVTVRKVWVQMSSSFPLQDLFAQALQQLRC